ncbi:capsular polysaccharide biosynthesis protein [Pseudoroseicyclus aestuarii]|uniref:capsular polysaccharide biosynthesis protein n=1 Tax=Pseudoroseicyclus aestuarii TaxID=1795041 RepID=UPI001FE3F65D|nr:capsular polysaccharide biosynthesis protein [Pseudoroseicyclus aestuarii]
MQTLGLRRPPIGRILTLAGWTPRLGLPRAGDWVGVWGQRPRARRGEALARRSGAPILRIEDAFLRSVLPGRAVRCAPLGLLLDRGGVHFDGSRPSDLEVLLATAPLDSPALLGRARDAMARLEEGALSKYSGFDLGAPLPRPGYVLLADQLRGDAALRACGAGQASFAAMLALARAEHPGARILIRRHPETTRGGRPGHFLAGDLGPGEAFADDALPPGPLLRGAAALYTVSSQLGFDAILAGLRPVVLGQPFYAGWGLSDDRAPLPRRGRMLSPAQLVAAALILQPVWYDPYRDRLCALETALDILEAQTRAWREDCRGWVAVGMRRWKRARLQDFFGASRRIRFATAERAPRIAQQEGRRLMVWGTRGTPALLAAGAVHVEDGVLRSRGLGAALTPPLSLALDDLGLPFDPARESRLERLIARPLPEHARARASRLLEQLLQADLTKYNLPGDPLPRLPPGRRILIPGQVEDDAALRLGGGPLRSNAALLQAVRAANPDALLLYKPHPDVEAGLRPGALCAEGPEGQAEVVLRRVPAQDALAAAEEVWTLTSTLGFEALLRGIPVTCLGRPFYAGWGLTRDLGPPIPRRGARPDLLQLVHAVLIAYPRYHDPVTGMPCPPEVALERLAAGAVLRPQVLRLLAALQPGLPARLRRRG